MQILTVRFRTNREFAEAYQHDLVDGGIFCPTTTPIDVDTQLVCELIVPALPNKVLIRGKVLSWRPALPRLRVRAGAIVAFFPEEFEKRDFILGMLKGERPMARKRKHTRIPIELEIRWRTADKPDFVCGGISEISVGGALLRTDSQLPLGTDVILEITPPGSVSPIAISGTVAYHAAQDASGIKFRYRDGGGTRRLRELVRRLRASGQE